MNFFDETPMFPSRSAWAPAPAPPSSNLSSADLAHAAVLEQMAHGATYDGGHTDGNVVSHDPGKTDRRAMLAGNGFDPEPRLITGKNGLQMVVYMPLPGSGAKPVVSFRGTEELADVRSDLNPDQVGADQYELNQELIDDTMKNVAEEFGPVEVTGHSLGGALAQMAASHNPEVTGHITTFQAAGVDADDVARIEEHNRQRAEAGLPPLTADHFRVAGDIVPVAGEGFAPGTIREMEIDAAPLHLPVVGDVDLGFTDPLSAHTSHPVTAAAMATAEGRAALPGIPAPAERVLSNRRSGRGRRKRRKPPPRDGEVVARRGRGGRPRYRHPPPGRDAARLGDVGVGDPVKREVTASARERREPRAASSASPPCT